MSAVWILTNKDLRSTAGIRAIIGFIAAKFIAQKELIEARQPQVRS